MRNVLIFGGGMMALLLLLPGGADGQKKENKSAATPATPQDYNALRGYSEISGKIIFADESTIAFRVEVPQVQPGGNKNQPRPKRGRPNVRPNVKLVMVGKDFELEVENKATVRKLFVAAEYDDKGFLKEDAEEKRQLRAKGYLPATHDDIKSGMVAKLYLTAPRNAGTDGKAAKPTVRRIDLLAAGTGSLQQDADRGKKKKNK
jgi:hypothetical protein